MIYVQVAESIAQADGSPPIDCTLLEHAARQVVEYASLDSDIDATLVLTDDAQITTLNHQFLGIDAPTDVLAFPAGETDPDTQTLYLGDVIVSYPRSLSQASTAGHPVEAELQLLVVHGTLHLLGYDHASEEQKYTMWAAQAEILTQLGCSITTPTE